MYHRYLWSVGSRCLISPTTNLLRANNLRRLYTTQPPKPPAEKPIQEQSSESIVQRIHKMLEVSPDSQTMLDIKLLLQAMEERQYNVNQLKWTVGIVGFILLFLSGKQIKSWLSSQTKDVTTQSMDDPEFKAKVSELSTEVAKDALSKLMDNDELKEKVKGYTKEVLQDSVTDMFENPEFQEKSKAMVEEVISSDRVIAKSKASTKKLLQDPDLQRTIGTTMRRSAIIGFMPTYFHPSDDESDDEKV